MGYTFYPELPESMPVPAELVDEGYALHESPTPSLSNDSPDAPRNEIPDADHAEALPGETSLANVLDMLLKRPGRLDWLLRDESQQRELLPRLLAVALLGFAIYGIVATLVLNAIWHQDQFWFPGVPAAFWNSASAGNLTLAYCLGLIAANCVCLPSFYFYGLLAGVKVSFLSVTCHALKSMAASAVALVGILPVYVALALTAVVFPAAPSVLAIWVLLGLALPFFAGLWGVANLYRGFVCLADTIPQPRRHSRECFLRRLILAWCACGTAVTPLMVYTLWNSLSKL